MPVKTIPAGQFRNKCSQLLDFVQRTGKVIVITKRGKPVAKLVPLEQERDEWFGRLKGQIKILGDIESPVDPPEAWESSR